MNDRFIDQVSLSDDITLVTLYQFPDSPLEMARLFSDIAAAGVNIDMISKTAPQGGNISISFTFDDSQLAQVLTVCAGLKPRFPGIQTELTTGNHKLSFYGEGMKVTPGAAARVFSFFAESGLSDLQVKLITTSEVDISILFDTHSPEHLQEKLQAQFGTEVL